MGRGGGRRGGTGCVGAGGEGTGREPGAQVLPLFLTPHTKGTVCEALLPKAGKSSREERLGALSTRQAGAIGAGIVGARGSSTDSPPLGDGGVAYRCEGVAPMLSVWPIALESRVGLAKPVGIPPPITLPIADRIELARISFPASARCRPSPAYNLPFNCPLGPQNTSAGSM